MAADEKYIKELEQYSSSFDIKKTVGKLLRNEKYIKLRLDQQQKDLGILNTKVEKCRALNVISFFHYLIGEEDNALETNKKSLEIDPDNIIALSNRARFLCGQKHFAETKQLFEKLEDVHKHPYKKVVAKAEIAFSYTVFGSRFCKEARVLFQEALTECNDGTDVHIKSSTEFKENLSTWYFGCTLAYKRLFNFGTIYDLSDLDISKESCIDACELCEKIIALRSHSHVCNLYAARAYTILGEIASELNGKSANLFPNKIRDVLPNYQYLHLEVDEYFNKALTYGYDCVFVLERSAKHFRHRRNISQAIKLLEKALTIKPTSQSHHHLALALKKQLEQQSGNQSHRHTQYGSSRNFPISRSSRPSDKSYPMREVTQQFAAMSTRNHGAESYSKQGQHYRLPAQNTNQRSFDHNEGGDRTRSNSKFEYRKGGRYSLPNDVGSSERASQFSASAGHSPNHHNGRGRHNRGHSWQYNRGYSDCFDSTDREKNSLKLYINCPRKCWNINTTGCEELLQKIIFHFDEAYRINMNEVALYQKGLLYRQVGDFHKALEIFRSLVQDKNGLCTKLTIANAYEQAGLCLNDMRFLSTNPEHDEENMKTYFKLSIEASCSLVAKLPSLENCWTSAPTLLSFLQGKCKTKQVLNDLKFLYDKMKDYKNAVLVLSDLCRLAEDDGEKMEIIVDKIKLHFDTRQFDDAVLAFDLLKCLPNWLDCVDKKLFVNVHIEGAIDAFKKDHPQIATLRFQNAFDFCKAKVSQTGGHANEESLEDGDDSEGEQYDLFVLHSSDDHTNVRKLGHILESLGLKIAKSIDTLPGCLIRDGVIGGMERSRHFIVVYDLKPSEEATIGQMKLYIAAMQDIIAERNHGNAIILTTTGHSKIPRIFYGLKKIEFDFGNEILENMHTDSDSLKPILTYLATGLD
ncbi:TPR repeat [Mactra antiquata]